MESGATFRTLTVAPLRWWCRGRPGEEITRGSQEPIDRIVGRRLDLDAEVQGKRMTTATSVLISSAA
jgi:hypothetical protein